MNSSGLSSAGLAGSGMGRMDGMRTSPGVSAGVSGDVDQMSQEMAHHNIMMRQGNGGLHHFPVVVPVPDYQKVTEQVGKLEQEIGSMSQEMAYLRHMVEYQNNKIAKMARLLSDVFNNKDVPLLSQLLQALQDGIHDDPFNVDTHTPMDSSVEVHDQVHEVHSLVNMPLLQPLVPNVVQGVNVQGVSGQNVQNVQNVQNAQNVPVLLDGNMDPQLHQVARAAVLAQKDNTHKRFLNGSPEKARPVPADKMIMPLDDGKGMDEDEMEGRKKPRIPVEFLHNPVTVREIYEEFTKGFRGQLPLREMDEQYGKQSWRGDSRSKWLKRFQRRKKLCDAIERGMEKYDKSADDIISYIEEFRGDKSLTWVMNGNLPSDLME